MNAIIQKLQKNRKFILGFIIIFGIFFYAFWYSLATKDSVVIPKMFSDARVSSDSIAKEFVTLSETTRDNLQKIKELDEKGKTVQALTSIRAEISRGDQLKSKGTELLGSLSQMTYSLSGVRPSGAQALAYEAITQRIEMVNNLVAYSGELEQILKLLTSRVIYGDNIKKSLQEKIDSANNYARNINDLNIKFNEAVTKLENF